MTLQLEVQYAVAPSVDLPEISQFEQWVNATLSAVPEFDMAAACELTIRVMDLQEMQVLNRDFRHQDKPTNVLSFPAHQPPYLGDIAICAPVVILEAQLQQKKLMAHWAHMTVHGVLHLLGYDHIEDEDAEVMEALEEQILMRMLYE